VGPYCRYCDHRCFVPRIVPGKGEILLATCWAGMEHDRNTTGGYDHTNTTNPYTPAP
jgi:hypothetical protein